LTNIPQHIIILFHVERDLDLEQREFSGEAVMGKLGEAIT
jgi:hypothetical protein